MRSGALIGRNIFENELYLLGGARQLRGFDEQSLPASKYAILTFEYRYIFGRYAYFGPFLDLSYIRNESGTLTEQSWPMGLGLNLALDTKAGIFLLSYALGKRDTDEPVEIRNGKIHFGYQSYF
jgi:hemolysin activation/secretion protein